MIFEKYANLKYKYWEPTFLVPGILCEHGRKESEGNRAVYPKSAAGRLYGDQLSIKEYVDPFTGEPVKEGKLK